MQREVPVRAQTAFVVDDYAQVGQMVTAIRSRRRSRRVLVVDDDSSARGYVNHILTRQGYEVVEAEDGLGAWAVLEGGSTTEICLLITDLEMPRMDGYGLGKKCAAAYPAIPILFISGGTPTSGADLATMGPLLKKPFTPRMLIEQVETFLHRE